MTDGLALFLNITYRIINILGFVVFTHRLPKHGFNPKDVFLREHWQKSVSASIYSGALPPHWCMESEAIAQKTILGRYFCLGQTYTSAKMLFISIGHNLIGQRIRLKNVELNGPTRLFCSD